MGPGIVNFSLRPLKVLCSLLNKAGQFRTLITTFTQMIIYHIVKTLMCTPNSELNYRNIHRFLDTLWIRNAWCHTWLPVFPDSVAHNPCLSWSWHDVWLTWLWVIGHQKVTSSRSGFKDFHPGCSNVRLWRNQAECFVLFILSHNWTAQAVNVKTLFA